MVREIGTAKGRKGWWFATVQSASLKADLPCVHQTYLRGGKPPTYDFEFAGNGGSKWPEYFAAIVRGRKVILTRDILRPTAPGSEPNYDRSAHIAVFEVDQVRDETDEDGSRHLRFRFVQRLIDLER